MRRKVVLDHERDEGYREYAESEDWNTGCLSLAYFEVSWTFVHLYIWTFVSLDICTTKLLFLLARPNGHCGEIGIFHFKAHWRMMLD